MEKESRIYFEVVQYLDYGDDYTMVYIWQN